VALTKTTRNVRLDRFSPFRARDTLWI